MIVLFCLEFFASNRDMPCYGAQRRLFIRLCLTASSCASDDQYFNTCNFLRPNSVIHSLNAALKSNINELPWWIALTLLQ